MSNYVSLVHHHLDQAYRENLNIGSPMNETLRDKLEADQDLRRVAEEEERRYSDSVCRRDYISRRRRAILRAALGREDS